METRKQEGKWESFMKKIVRRTIPAAMTMAMLGTAFGGCASKPAAAAKETVPADYQWASYYSEEDAPFLPKDIFSEELFVSGIVTGDVGVAYLDITDRTDIGAYVLSGEYGKCYEVKVPEGVTRVCAVKLPFDPQTTAVGEKIWFQEDNVVYNKENITGEASFMYNCRQPGEYLVLYADTAEPIYIGQRSMLEEKDTQDTWFIPEEVGSIGVDCTFGNFMWTSEEVITNLYEPVRERHPEYITRTVIGKDQSGAYDMYGYIYAPENYEVTMFLSGGMHANEETGYYALAKLMQLISDATPEQQQLYTLRQKVRFVVVPIINVWGVSQPHDGSGGVTTARIRKNSTETDLNRDFGNLSQQESKNVDAFFAQYAGETSIAMDFHTAKTAGIALWFNFINFTDNAVANYKTTNHMYHRYMELGYAQKQTDITHIPGSYRKDSKYIEGRLWNEYGVPTITVEYVVNDIFPNKFSSEAVTLAVETYGNFIIQNALFFLN